MNEDIDISVVVPVYNEYDSIDELVARTARAMENSGLKYELVCVDDKSEDQSVDKLQAFRSEYPIRIIELGKHMGQSAALAAGFMRSRGKYVVMIDADLQCQPEDITILLENKDKGISAVCGIREKRMDSVNKKVSTFVGNTFRNMVTGDDIRDTNCPLKIFNREAINSIPYFNGFHRFIPTLLKIRGYKIKQVPVGHFRRKHGKSKYSIKNRLFKGLMDVFGVLWIKKNALIFDKMEEL